MKFSCSLGFHQWDGCKCRGCGKARDKEHNWSTSCEKCSKCGATRQDAHQWDGLECKTCGSFKPFPSGDRPVGWVTLPCVAITLPGVESKTWEPERGFHFRLLLVRLRDNAQQVHFKSTDYRLKSPSGHEYHPIGICCSLTSNFRAAIGQPVPAALTASEADLEQWTDHYGVLFAVDNRENDAGELDVSGRVFPGLRMSPPGGDGSPIGKVDTRIRALSAIAIQHFVPFGNERGTMKGFRELMNPSRNGGILAVGNRELNILETTPKENFGPKLLSIVVVRIPEGVGNMADGLDTDRISAPLNDGSVLQCAGIVISGHEQYDPKPVRMFLTKARISRDQIMVKPGGMAGYERELMCPVTSYTELERKAVVVFDARLTTDTVTSVKINNYEAHYEDGATVFEG